jgi:Ca2+:H+ antiporter
MLFLSYVIGLWFTLRTHAATIWYNEPEDREKKSHANINISHHFTSSQPQPHKQRSGSAGARPSIKDTELYQRVLGQSLRHVGLAPVTHDGPSEDAPAVTSPNLAPFIIPPKSGDERSGPEMIEGLSEEQNTHLARQVAEMAATAATVAARDVARAPRRTHLSAQQAPKARRPSRPPTIREETEGTAAGDAGSTAGAAHDAPNWSKLKSAVILLGATVLYAIIAEILVDTVDVVLENIKIDEKFLGITLFALVPSTTELLVSGVPWRDDAC